MDTSDIDVSSLVSYVEDTLRVLADHVIITRAGLRRDWGYLELDYHVPRGQARAWFNREIETPTGCHLIEAFCTQIDSMLSTKAFARKVRTFQNAIVRRELGRKTQRTPECIDVPYWLERSVDDRVKRIAETHAEEDFKLALEKAQTVQEKSFQKR